MREILFRGKGINTGEWRYGNFVVENWTSKIVTNTGEKFSVVTATVGQYTEVDDVDGNKIFEGDIVRLSSKPDLSNNQIKRGLLHHEKTAIVVTDKGRWVAKRQLNNGSYYNIGLYDDDYDFAVIGNTTDNPELLEVK
jgi:uncharacterized phage protein (TIGR01671 family)